jgi:hypothetical protein
MSRASSAAPVPDLAHSRHLGQRARTLQVPLAADHRLLGLARLDGPGQLRRHRLRRPARGAAGAHWRGRSEGACRAALQYRGLPAGGAPTAIQGRPASLRPRHVRLPPPIVGRLTDAAAGDAERDAGVDAEADGRRRERGRGRGRGPQGVHRPLVHQILPRRPRGAARARAIGRPGRTRPLALRRPARVVPDADEPDPRVCQVDVRRICSR